MHTYQTLKLQDELKNISELFNYLTQGRSMIYEVHRQTRLSQEISEHTHEIKQDGLELNDYATFLRCDDMDSNQTIDTQKKMRSKNKIIKT